jgi:hypothetical protein
VSKAFLIMQVAPVAWMFLQFINYWNICSFYCLMNITIPDYFKDCLQQIFAAVNSSVFQVLDINLKLGLDFREIVNDKNLL